MKPSSNFEDPSELHYTRALVVIGLAIVTGCNIFFPKSEDAGLLAFTTSVIAGGQVFGIHYGKWPGLVLTVAYSAGVLWTYGSSYFILPPLAAAALVLIPRFSGRIRKGRADST